MEPEGPLLCSQGCAIGPCSKPPTYLISLRFVLTLSALLRLDLPSGLFSSVYVFHLSHACYMSAHLILLNVIFNYKNESSGSIRGGGYLDQLLKKDSVPWSKLVKIVRNL